MTIVHNADINAVELQPSNHAKECTNWAEWQNAFCMFMAVYVTAHPDTVLDLLKYEKTIQDASHCFKWDAVLVYNYQFCQYITEYPTMLWGVKNAELCLECFNGYSALTLKQLKPAHGGHNPQSMNLTCNKYKKGTCIWGKNCKYAHHCSKC